MALRMTPVLMDALERLHEAGVLGTGDHSVAGAPILEMHGLAERSRGRYRLTLIGERFAEFFFEGTISMSDHA